MYRPLSWLLLLICLPALYLSGALLFDSSRPTPALGPLADAEPRSDLVFDLRDPEERARWRLRTGVALADAASAGLALRSSGLDPQLSRPLDAGPGGIERVELRTAAPFPKPFRVYLQIGGREAEPWAADTEAFDGGTRHVARFGELTWRSGAVTGLRIDPPAGDHEFVLSSVAVAAMPARAAHRVGAEHRECLRADSVTAPARGLGRDRLIVGLGIPPQVRAAERPGRLVVEITSGKRSLLHRSIHRVPLRPPRWQEVLVDLELPGRSSDDVRLAMRLEAPDGDERLVACYTEPHLLPGRAERAERVNVLLVSLDTLRADFAEHAPFLERLGEEGRRFARTWASSNWTLPSHVSLFTSMDVLEHDQPPRGLLLPFIGAGIPDALATLAEALRAAGYATAATTEGGFVDPTYGFTRGFERYGVTVGAEHPLREHLRFARAVAAGTHHRPFFLFVHTFEIHDYFQNTPEYHDFVDGERDAERVRAGNLIEAVRVGRADPDYVARLYAAGVRRGDEFLEELVNAVRVASGDAPLLVVVTSDHGESFGEKGAWHHGTSMYEEQLRVPLVVWGNFDGAPHGASDAPTSTIDVAPSLLRYLDLPIPETFRGEDDRFAAAPPRGRSRPIVAANTGTARDDPAGGHLQLALLEDPLKYVRRDRFDGRTELEQCFDLDSDPGEDRDHGRGGSTPCAAFPALYGRLLREQLGSALFLRSPLPVRLEVASSATPPLAGVRSAHPSALPIADLQSGRLAWQPAGPEDTLAVVLSSRPELRQVALDGRLVAERVRPEALGTAGRPLVLRADAIDATVALFARGLPADRAEAPEPAADDEALRAQLEALGYVER